MTTDTATPDAAGDLYDTLRRAGARRTRALKRANDELDVIVAQVALILTTGAPVNKERAAKVAGISKKTLYDRLAKAGVDVTDDDDA